MSFHPSHNLVEHSSLLVVFLRLLYKVLWWRSHFPDQLWWQGHAWCLCSVTSIWSAWRILLVRCSFVCLFTARPSFLFSAFLARAFKSLGSWTFSNKWSFGSQSCSPPDDKPLLQPLLPASSCHRLNPETNFQAPGSSDWRPWACSVEPSHTRMWLYSIYLPL